jgi:hypothetical protein
MIFRQVIGDEAVPGQILSRLVQEMRRIRRSPSYNQDAQSPHSMDVIPLTLTISLCLVFTFVLFFLREHSRHPFSSAERESLLPLADETPRPEGMILLGKSDGSGGSASG